METYYDVFKRTWWKDGPLGREPCPGERAYLARHVTYRDAREICREYNSTHEPGRLNPKPKDQLESLDEIRYYHKQRRE